MTSGMISRSAGVRAALALLILGGAAARAGAQCQSLQQTFANPAPASGDQFGQSVAISGNYVVIGAYKDNEGGIDDAGHVFLYDATTGALLKTFKHPSPVLGDEFGYAVAISGNHVLIGVRYDDVSGVEDTGSAYLYDLSAPGAIDSAPITMFRNPAGAAPFDEFGTSVAISGDYVLVGAPNDDFLPPGKPIEEDAGRAYLFDALTGTLLRSFAKVAPLSGDEFGFSVAISGTSVLIGSPDDHVSPNAGGAAYLFDATTGARLQTFNNPTPASADRFGAAVAIAAGRVLIGARNDDTAAVDAGSAYLFDAATGGALLPPLYAPGAASGDTFGLSVAISASGLLVGAPAAHVAPNVGGSVHLFDPTTGALLRTLDNPTPAAADRFGISVALDDEHVLAGDGNDDAGAPDAGRAYLFGCPSTFVSPNEEASGRFGVSVVGSNDTTGDGRPDVLIGAYYEDPGSVPTDSGKAYVYTGDPSVASGAEFGLARELSSPSPATGGLFGRNLRGAGDLNADGIVDLVVSAPGETAGGFVGAGRVHLFDGATGALIRTLQSPNPETGGQFGARGNGINDVTGDGKTDILVSSTFEDPGASPTDAGRVYLFNGQTGALFRTLISPWEEPNGNFGLNAIGLKDVTGDGKGDLLVGAPGEDPGGLPDDSGMVYLFNGATGLLSWYAASPSPQLAGRFGSVVSRLDDVTGDGKMDAAVGAPAEAVGGNAGAGRVHLLNGATGAFLRTINAPNPEVGAAFGQSIANIPDTNGDGWGDLVIGAPYVNNPGITDAGRAYVISGRNGAILRAIDSPDAEASAEFGFAVGAAPDLDGNGYSEYVIGARKADPGAAPSDAGRAYLFYGKLLP